MPKYDLELVKSKVNIVDIARGFGYEVKNNLMRCFCPQNHKNGDAHPSLRFNPIKNSYRCMVCPDNKGDVITFVMNSRGLDFFNAVRYLAGKVGIEPLPSNHSLLKKMGEASRPISRDKDEVAGSNIINQTARHGSLNILNSKDFKNEINEFADIYLSFFELLGKLPHEAIGYLENRGISLHTAEKMQVRYLYKAREVEEKLFGKFPLEKLIKSGLVNSDGHLLLSRHKLIWTYFLEAVPVYFQGRSIGSTSSFKEMNLAHHIPCPYNFDILKTNPETIRVCEGCIDALTLIEHDLPAVSVPGVNTFKEQWIPLFNGIKVKIAFDADSPGQTKGADLLGKFKEAGIDAKKIYLPEGYDVNRLFQVLKQFQD